MKTNFKKLAMAAGITTVLAGMSIPAHAQFLGNPGEAALVPLAVHSPGYLNTVVKITVPKSVGNDVISNFYTAPHSSPTNGGAPNPKLTPGSENPGAVALTAGNGVTEPNLAVVKDTSYIHWYWLNQYSDHEVDGQFPVTQDDVAVFDWAAVDAGNAFLNRYGYLVFVTASGDQGKDADFSFFTDAWLVVGSTVAQNVKVSIPAVPMSDGADGTSDNPTLLNNVVELSTAGKLIVKASPLVSGDRTIWSDGKANSYVFDLPLANNFNGSETLAVFWNDRNAGWTGSTPPVAVGPWRNMNAFRFTNNEVKCSGKISLPDQLNLVFIPSTTKAGAFPTAVSSDLKALWTSSWKGFTPDEPITGSNPGPGAFSAVTGVGDPYADGVASAANNPDLPKYYARTAICTPPLNDGANNGPLPPTNAPVTPYPVLTAWNDAGLSGGFIKVVAPEPADNNLQTVEGAAIAFTIPLFSNGWGGWSGWPLFLGDTLLAHPRGAFTNAPN